MMPDNDNEVPDDAIISDSALITIKIELELIYLLITDAFYILIRLHSHAELPCEGNILELCDCCISGYNVRILFLLRRKLNKL